MCVHVGGRGLEKKKRGDALLFLKNNEDGEGERRERTEPCHDKWESNEQATKHKIEFVAINKV